MEIPAIPLQPHYELSEDGATAIYEGPADLVSDSQGACVPGECTIRLLAQPYRGYVFRFEGPAEGKALAPNDFAGLALNGHTVAFQITFFDPHLGSADDRLIVEGWFIEDVLLGNPCAVDAVDFHLMNFPRIRDRTVERADGGSTSWIRAVGEAPTWTVVIDETDSAAATTSSVLSQNRITHVGRLLRTDGKPVDLKWAQKRLETLRRFLSLLAGRWNGPLLAVGVYQAQECWSLHRNFYVGTESMGAPLVPSLGHVDWASYSRALARFEALREEEGWSDLMKRVVTWYVEANTTRDTATTVVLSQAGLELMAWARLGLCGGLAAGFEKLRAADTIRHTLMLSGIPVEMTDAFKQLVLEHLGPEQRKHFSERNFDGPDWITEVRNAVIHPKPKPDVSDAGILQLAGRLGLRYLELLLMNLLGYDGFVRNRTVPGFPDERVPWSAAQTWPSLD